MLRAHRRLGIGGIALVALAVAVVFAAAFAGCGQSPSAGGASVRQTARGGDLGADGFRVARGTRDWRFPRDHAAHPEYATEWWYTTGIVRTEGGRTFGYEVTFFRIGLMRPDAADGAAVAPPPTSPWRARELLLAHVAVSDVEGDNFLVDRKLERAAHGWAGADRSALDVWIGDWRIAQRDAAFELRVPPESTGGQIGLDLTLSTARPPVLHGRGGLSAKDARADPHASWYASLPRLETEGTLTVAGQRFRVAGATWMDHEFFSGGLAEGQAGWDWFSIRLEDGRDLMLYRLRGRSGETDHVSGTVTSPDGATSRGLDVRGAAFDPLETWRSPESGAEYPVAWRVRLPAEELELLTRTPLPQQEVRTDPGVAFTYWEGLVDYRGRWAGEDVRGEGYVELTGYEAPLRLR